MIFCGEEFSLPTAKISDAKVDGDCVYLIIFDGEVKYVGATSNLYQRIAHHKCRKFKGVNFEFSYLKSEKAFEIENTMILITDPEFNKSKTHFSKNKNPNGKDTVEVKIYLKKPLKDRLTEESKKSGDSMSFIMLRSLERELKRRSK